MLALLPEEVLRLVCEELRAHARASEEYGFSALISFAITSHALAAVALPVFRLDAQLATLGTALLSIMDFENGLLVHRMAIGDLTSYDVVPLVVKRTGHSLYALRLPCTLASGALFRELALATAMWKNEDFHVTDDDWVGEVPHWPTVELLSRYYAAPNGSSLPIDETPFFHHRHRYPLRKQRPLPRYPAPLPPDLELTFTLGAAPVRRPFQGSQSSEDIYVKEGRALWGMSWLQGWRSDPSADISTLPRIHLVWDHVSEPARLLVASELPVGSPVDLRIPARIRAVEQWVELVLTSPSSLCPLSAVRADRRP